MDQDSASLLFTELDSNMNTKELCDSSTDVLKDIDSMLTEFDQDIFPDMTLPDDDSRNYLDGRCVFEQISTFSESTSLDPSKHSPISLDSVAGHISKSSKILDPLKHKPILSTSSSNNLEYKKCFSKRKFVRLNLPVEHSSEATKTNVRPKHKRISIEPSNEDVLRASKTLNPSKQKPIPFDSSSENISKPPKIMMSLKRKPTTLNSSNENSSNVKTPFLPKRKHIPVHSSEGTHFNKTKNPTVKKRKPIIITASTENCSLASETLSQTDKKLSFNSSVGNISKGVENLVKGEVTLQECLFDSTKVKDSDINEICQAFQKSIITSKTSQKSINTSGVKNRKDVKIPLRKWSPSENLAPINEITGTEHSQTLSKPILSQGNAFKGDVKPQHLQSDVKIPGVSSSKMQMKAVLLYCSKCKQHTDSGRLFWCACRIVCESCGRREGTCDLCATTHAADARLVNFHITTPHPCHYQDCTQAVRNMTTPQHNMTQCFVCKEFVPTLFSLFERHFEKFHSDHVLAARNDDVKFSAFLKVDSVRERMEMFYFNLKMLILIGLENIADEWKFVVTILSFNAPVSSIWVTFTFTSEGSSYTYKKVCMMNDHITALGVVELPSDTFKDWTTGKSKLNVSLVVKRLTEWSEDSPRDRKHRRAMDGLYN